MVKGLPDERNLEFAAILAAMSRIAQVRMAVLYLRYLALWVCRILLEYLPEWYKVVYVAV